MPVVLKHMVGLHGMKVSVSTTIVKILNNSNTAFLQFYLTFNCSTLVAWLHVHGMEDFYTCGFMANNIFFRSLQCRTSLEDVEALESKSARTYASPFGTSEHQM